MRRAPLADDIQIRFIATLKTPFKFSPDICRARLGLGRAFPAKPKRIAAEDASNANGACAKFAHRSRGHPGSTQGEACRRKPRCDGHARKGRLTWLASKSRTSSALRSVNRLLASTRSSSSE